MSHYPWKKLLILFQWLCNELKEQYRREAIDPKRQCWGGLMALHSVLCATLGQDTIHASMASSSFPQKEQLFYLCIWEAICCCPELSVKHLMLLASRLEGFTCSQSCLPCKGRGYLLFCAYISHRREIKSGGVSYSLARVCGSSCSLSLCAYILIHL